MKHTDATFVPNALKLTEQAMHLLRRNRLKVLTDYYIGSLPFIFGLLYFWSDMSRNPYAYSYCSPAAAGLALLFIWMKYWHVRFCRRLWCALHDTKPERLTPVKELAVMARQAFIQSTGLIVQPISLAILFPMAWTTAFYQNATVMEHPHSTDLKGLYKKAIKQSSLWPGQNHLILCILPFFSIIVFLNIVFVMIALPYLLKKLMGIETVFTISGIHAMTNTTFFAIACALTYLCVDPINKAAYTLRCFYSESRFTGDDIRINLKPYLKTGALAILLVFVSAMPFTGALARETEPDSKAPDGIEIKAYAQEMDRSIDRVLQKPEFAWRLPREAVEIEKKENNGWLTTAMEWIFEKLDDMFTAIGKWLESIAEWFQDLFPKKEYQPSDSHALGTVFRVIMYVIAAVLLVFMLVLLRRYIKSKALARSRITDPEDNIKEVDLNDESVIADELPHDRWLSLAMEAMDNKDLRQAMRALYLAVLAQLGDKHRIVIARYKSNRDYLAELSSHAHAEPELFSLFENCMRMFERFWYGMHPVAMDKLNHFKSCQERISTLVQQ